MQPLYHMRNLFLFLVAITPAVPLFGSGANPLVATSCTDSQPTPVGFMFMKSISSTKCNKRKCSRFQTKAVTSMDSVRSVDYECRQRYIWKRLLNKRIENSSGTNTC